MTSRKSGCWRSTSNARKSLSCSSRKATSAQRRAAAHAQTLHVTPRLTSLLELQNCLREVRAAIELGKPLILVHEADPGKSGGTLQELRAECPEELEPDIFDTDWPMTVWHRVKEYQTVSLTIVAEAPHHLDPIRTC